jgi:predicted nucleic acid-binding protein
MAECESLPLGATDATVVALAERHNDRDIATLDRRHFTVIVSSIGPLHLFRDCQEVCVSGLS